MTVSVFHRKMGFKGHKEFSVFHYFMSGGSLIFN